MKLKCYTTDELRKGSFAPTPDWAENRGQLNGLLGIPLTKKGKRAMDGLTHEPLKCIVINHFALAANIQKHLDLFLEPDEERVRHGFLLSGYIDDADVQDELRSAVEGFQPDVLLIDADLFSAECRTRGTVPAVLGVRLRELHQRRGKVAA